MIPQRSQTTWYISPEENKENISLDFNPFTCSPSSPIEIRDQSSRNFDISSFWKNENASHELMSPISSGYGSLPPSESPFRGLRHQIYSDELSSSFSSLLRPIQSYGEMKNEDTSSPPSYSLLSRFNFSDMSSVFDFDNTPPKPIDHDEIQRDFDLNGRTLDYDENEPSFTPSVSSTPIVDRKSAQSRQFESFRMVQPVPQFQRRSYDQPKPWMKNKKPSFQGKKKSKPNKKSLDDHCVFCKNNGEDERAYRTHTVKDHMGRVLCPILRQYKCPICGVDGDKSHTVKYCPKKPIITEEDIERMGSMKFSLF